MSDQLPTVQPPILNSGADIPEYLKQHQAEAEKTQTLVSGFLSLPKISIKGKQFRYTRGDEEQILPSGTPINLIILAADPEND